MKSIVFGLAGLLCASAQAVTLYTASPGGPRPTDSAFVASFEAGAGDGTLRFTLDGYGSLDGDHFWIDIAEVRINGLMLLAGSWNLGGGGIDRVLVDPNGALITRTSAQQLEISVPLTLLGGLNTISIGVFSPSDFESSARAGFQGLGDEGWGLARIAVDGVAAPIPEPASLALLAGGLALLGASTRRGARR